MRDQYGIFASLKFRLQCEEAPSWHCSQNFGWCGLAITKSLLFLLLPDAHISTPLNATLVYPFMWDIMCKRAQCCSEIPMSFQYTKILVNSIIMEHAVGWVQCYQCCAQTHGISIFMLPIWWLVLSGDSHSLHAHTHTVTLHTPQPSCPSAEMKEVDIVCQACGYSR